MSKESNSITPDRPSALRDTSNQAALINSAVAAKPLDDLMERFEKSIESCRQKLKVGIQGFVWDGYKISKAEVVMKLVESDGEEMLVFHQLGSNR